MNEGYAWAWYDGEDVYANTTESLKSLIEEIIEYYFGDYIKDLTIDSKDNHISIDFFHDDEDRTHSSFICGNNYQEVKELLKKLAMAQDREDIFDIKPLFK